MPVLFGLFALLLILGVPVAICIALASITYLGISGLYSQLITVQRIALVVESWPLIAIPLFILGGTILSQGQTGGRIVDFAYKLIGHISGGLGLATVVSNMIMGGISGSAAADCSGIGSVVIPEMKKKGYPAHFAAALNACSSTIGIIIPPSIPMILFSWVSGASIGELFIAGIIPGILVGLVQMCVVYYLARRHHWYRSSAREPLLIVIKAFASSWPALLAPILIVGGIFSGAFTATEVAAVLFVYAVIIEGVIYKSMDVRGLLSIACQAARTTGVVMLLIATSNILSHILVTLHMPQLMTQAVLSVTDNYIVILVWINVALLVIGCFMDLAPAILIFAPVIIPMCQEIGMDIIQIGIMMVANLAIGLFTPPVGTSLFISCSLSGVSVERGSQGVAPFFIGMVAVLMLITYFSPTSLWLVNVLIR